MRKKGNIARFINHSCNPNAIAETYSHQGKDRILLFALCDIKHGQEITYRYQFDIEETNFKQRCQCNEPNCSGYIGISAS